MKRETKEVIKLTSREILAFLANKVDKVAVAIDDIFSHDHGYHRRKSGYVGPEEVDWSKFKQKVNRLKRLGLIRKTVEGKVHYLEITDQGKKHLKNKNFAFLAINHPERWDKKWRLIIYDVPEDDRNVRDIVRHELYSLGFEQIQKSVFVYPFECSEEINLICERYGGRSCIKYMIAEIIEGEESIIETFMDKGVLLPEDLRY